MLIRRLWLVVTTILFCGIATISGQANMEKNLVVNNQNAMTLSQPLSQRLRASQNLMPNLVANAVVNDADSTSDDGKIADEGVFGTCHWIQYNNGLVTFDGGERGSQIQGAFLIDLKLELLNF